MVKSFFNNNLLTAESEPASIWWNYGHQYS